MTTFVPPCPPETNIVRSRVRLAVATSATVLARVAKNPSVSDKVLERIGVVVRVRPTILMRVTKDTPVYSGSGHGLVFVAVPTTTAVTQRVSQAAASSATIEGLVTRFVGTTVGIKRLLATSFDPTTETLATYRYRTTTNVNHRVSLVVPAPLEVTSPLTKAVATSATVVGRVAKGVATTSGALSRPSRTVLTLANVIDLSGRVFKTAHTTATVRARTAKARSVTNAVLYYQAPLAPIGPLAVARDGATTSTIDLAWASPGADGSLGMGYGTFANYVIFAQAVGGTSPPFVQIGTSSTPSFSWAGGVLGTGYLFRVQASNHEVGKGARLDSTQPLAPALAPAAPVIVGVLQSSPGNLTVSWNAPAANGAAVDLYELQISTDNISFASLGSFAGTSFTVGGLTNGVTYYFRVRARNASGVGNAEVYGAFSASVAQFPATVPNAVLGVFAVTGDASAPRGNVVSWVAPAFNGSSSPVYNISRNGGFYDQIPAGGTGTSALGNAYNFASGVQSYSDLTHIVNGATYVYQVSPYGIVGGVYLTPGISPQSPAVTPSGIPGTMVAPTTSVGGTLTNLLRWQVPGNNGSPITGYRLHRSDGVDIDLGPLDKYTDAAGLSAGTSYTYTILAKNGATTVGGFSQPGWGNLSPASAPVVAVAPPAQPSAPTVSHTGTPTQLLVSWTAPASNGSPLNGVYLYRDDGGFSTGNVLVYFVTGSSLPLSHLDGGVPGAFIVPYPITVGVAYTYTVQYANLAGNSPVSSGTTVTA